MAEKTRDCSSVKPESSPSPSLVDTRPSAHRERSGDRNCKDPCLLFLCPTYGVSSDSNKGTIGEEFGLWTRIFHSKGVTLVEVGLTPAQLVKNALLGK
ncbi:hypothetical protein AVEN_73679-1 [Araneus ventricosus]|uniref:Uncharacterized protein n=1 Tax=Araneus ventricosus TaxID=182803 RepID=A0A4Y2HQV9_ARAVE|nr:hypothetical protein AVEN_73679-1 [Araneus ventricosus]